MPSSYTVLGLDPGYDRLGIAIIEKKPSGEHLLHSECFRTSKKEVFSLRLNAIARRTRDIISQYAPQAAVLEKTFFSTNRKTAIAVSEARGALLYIITEARLDIFEYTPSQVKVAITGYGNSTKDQVALMVHKLLVISKTVAYDDEYDAIAVALTHCAHHRPIPPLRL